MASFGGFLLGCLALCTLSSAYPMYGPKRYGAYRPLSMPFYTPRYAYPYSQELTDIYPQDPYDGRYRFVQVPFYFPEAASPPYYYDEEELPPEEEDPQELDPYGQDWYNQDANAKANAFFLQNLILTEMYKDAQQKQQMQQQQEQSRYPVLYGYPTQEDGFPAREDYEDYVYGEQIPKEPSERDDDVSQLKSLAVAESSKRQQLKKKIQESKTRFSDNTWSENKRTSEKKGQEEVVLPRPANPVRGPAFHQRSHEPSAYDAIKKLLHVQSQQKTSGNRQPQKRSYIPNEDSLVEQLGSLKKSA